MRIPNMCLVLKLDKGKVIFIVDEQTDKATQYGILAYIFSKQPPLTFFFKNILLYLTFKYILLSDLLRTLL